MAELFEAMMLICFGISWPFAIMKSWRSKTSKGKSIIFLSFVLLGYILGILAKLISGNISYVLFFYILDFLLVATDTYLYFKNSNLDRLNKQEI